MAIFVAPEIKKGAPVAKVSKPVQQIDLFSEMGDQEDF
jgi:hypothetical protein